MRKMTNKLCRMRHRTTCKKTRKNNVRDAKQPPDSERPRWVCVSCSLRTKCLSATHIFTYFSKVPPLLWIWGPVCPSPSHSQVPPPAGFEAGYRWRQALTSRMFSCFTNPVVLNLAGIQTPAAPHHREAESQSSLERPPLQTPPSFDLLEDLETSCPHA